MEVYESKCDGTYPFDAISPNDGRANGLSWPLGCWTQRNLPFSFWTAFDFHEIQTPAESSLMLSYPILTPPFADACPCLPKPIEPSSSSKSVVARVIAFFV
jgi:hypothetical protein